MNVTARDVAQSSLYILLTLLRELGLNYHYDDDDFTTRLSFTDKYFKL